MTREETIHFVRHTLGCACPDEVFHAVSREERGNKGILFDVLGSVDPDAAAVVHGILSVGGRLLVMICGEVRVEDLAILLDAGVSVRDRMGYRRIRVAFTDLPGEGAAADHLLSNRDPRVHLHRLGGPRGR